MQKKHTLPLCIYVDTLIFGGNVKINDCMHFPLFFSGILTCSDHQHNLIIILFPFLTGPKLFVF